MSTTVISMTDVSKRFVIRKEKSLKERLVNWGRSNKFKDDFWALQDVSLDIESGSTVGLVGPNGSGKSTLLKMVGGILQPTSGSVMVRGRIAALLELGAGFHPDLTGRENVYLNASILGISKAETDRYFDAIVDFSGIEPFIDTQVKFYSSGMYVRLAFAVAVHVDPDILLVDEVLAVGDEPFQQKCMDRIRQFQSDGRTIVFVSHALGQVADLCDRAVVMGQGKVLADGPPEQSLRVLYEEFDERRAADMEKNYAASLAADAGYATADAAGDSQGDGHDRPAQPVAPVITAVEVVDADTGQVPQAFGPQANILVRISITSSTEITGAMVGCGIDDQRTVRALGSGTERNDVFFDLPVGDSQVEFTFTGVQLGENIYYAAASLANSARQQLAYKRGTRTFRVIHPTDATDGYTTSAVSAKFTAL